MNDSGTAYPVYGGGGESFRTDAFNREDEYVISRFAMSATCMRKVTGKFWMLDSGFTFEPIDASVDKDFIAYWLFNMQPAIYACSSQGAQKNLKIDDFKKFLVPVPPMPVQREIVAILDTFTKLEAELEAELEARRRQYTYYRDGLMNLDSPEVRWVTMGELGDVFGGLTGKSKEDFAEGNCRYVSYVNVFNNLRVDLSADDFVSVSQGERQKQLQVGDILFTGSSESSDEVAMSSVVTQQPDGVLYLNSFCIALRPHASHGLNPEFAKHLFRSSAVRRDLVRTANGVTRFNVSKVRLKDVRIPMPTGEEQARIAGILDDFESLTGDLTSGLPAELAARRQQYEYYRDRLFDFPRLAA